MIKLKNPNGSPAPANLLLIAVTQTGAFPKCRVLLAVGLEV